MRKVDLATEIYEKVGISKKEAAEIVELVLAVMKAALHKGEMVKVAGFGHTQWDTQRGSTPRFAFLFAPYSVDASTGVT